MGSVNENDILDEEAKNLYEQLEGIDFRNRNLPVNSIKDISGLLDFTDKRRILLVDFAYLLSMYFEKLDFYQETPAEIDTFKSIQNILKALDEWYFHDKTIIIKYRGVSEDIEDYDIHFGNLRVDADMIPIIMGRMEVPLADLPHRAKTAFKTFSEKGISNILIKIPDDSPKSIDIFHRSLKVISHFNKSVKHIFSFVGGRKKDQNSIALIYNENSQPDPNLTLTAEINNIKQQVFQDLIQKIHQLLQKTNSNQFLSVYDALFSIKKLPFHLIRPPIEINKLTLAISGSETDKITEEKVTVVKHVIDDFGGYSPEAHRVIESVYGDKTVYGNEFIKQNAKTVNKRLQYALRILETSQHTAKANEIEKEVVTNVGKRLDRISDDVLNELFMPKEIAELRDDIKEPIKGTEIFYGTQSIRFQKMIQYFKRRCIARDKIKSLIETNKFDDVDFTIIARQYDISEKDANTIVYLIKSCFDPNGLFNKSMFEKKLSELGRFGTVSFEFFWYILKSTNAPRRNRITFLNSIQLLIERLNYRKNALKTILADVFGNPTTIHFSDRNAMLLANLLMRTYNKEKNVEIELTPEEVLLVEKGVKADLVNYAWNIIDTYQEVFLIKVVTVQKLIKNALQKDSKNKDKQSFPIRFLFGLEREIFSFFSLVKGVTSCAIMRIAMKEYGDPKSEIYNLYKSSFYLPTLFQHLRVVIRGFGRIGEESDIDQLHQVIGNKNEFLAFDVKFTPVINKIIELAYESIDRINKRKTNRMILHDTH